MSVLLAVLLAAASAPSDPAARPPDTVPVAGRDDAPRRGTYVEAALGVFTAMGGSRRFSSGQPYLGMTVGHDLGALASVFASLGVGAASASCYQAGPGGECLGADSFGATFLELGVSYGMPLLPRTLFSVKLLGGYTDLSPGPVQSTGGSVPDHLGGFHAGAGLSFDYDTRLDHFALGLDALFRETFARSLNLPSLAVMPRIRYVF